MGIVMSAAGLIVGLVGIGLAVMVITKALAANPE